MLSRRLMGTVAAAAMLAFTGTAQAETVLRMSLHSDLKIVDPIWTTALITAHHANMIYDTLFAQDEKQQLKPQMVDKYEVSADKLTWTFTLRDGLEWHDGKPVLAEDCVASLKRWSARDSMGQRIAAILSEYRVVDAKTFQIVLKEKFGPLLDALGRPSVVVPFMMPKKVAETDPFKQIDVYTGSGPFILKQDEWKPGEKMVFVKNTKYRPRAEPASGLAGGKVVGVDRVEWLSLPDVGTQVNALIAGEIDVIDALDFDHLPMMEKAQGVQILKRSVSNQYVFRMNWRTPPFNDVRVRRAVAYALSQEEFLQASVGNPAYYRTCKAMFTCGSPLESTAGMEGLLEGNAAKAKALLAEAKYDGTPIVIPQPTDLQSIRQLAPVAKAQLERAGFKVEVLPMDWQSMNARLEKKGPPSEGGWNAFGTGWSQMDILNPLTTAFLIATCDKARAGWPCDERLEELRGMQVVTHIPLGEWFAVGAARSNVIFPQPLPPVPVFWGITKK
jgi:peptide/nickel transport system substrate-binding protein